MKWNEIVHDGELLGLEGDGRHLELAALPLDGPLLGDAALRTPDALKVRPVAEAHHRKQVGQRALQHAAVEAHRLELGELHLAVHWQVI